MCIRDSSVFGATGSVGESTYDLLIRAGGPAAFRTVALTGGRNVARLAEMARTLQAVSYTHLDVYKRQPQDRLAVIEGKTGHSPGRLAKEDPMSDDLEIDLDAIQRRMDGAMNALKTEFASLRTGRASASIVEPIICLLYTSRCV